MHPTELNAVAGVGTDQLKRNIPMARIPASEQTRKQIAEVLRGDFDKSALLRNAVRLIIEEALEEIYTAKGWRLTDVGPEDVGSGPHRRLFPNLAEFYRSAVQAVTGRGYRGDLQRIDSQHLLHAGLCHACLRQPVPDRPEPQRVGEAPQRRNL